MSRLLVINQGALGEGLMPKVERLVRFPKTVFPWMEDDTDPWKDGKKGKRG